MGFFFISGRKRNNNGVTLVELMMVVLIFSVIASIALPLGKIQFVRGKEEDLRQYLQDFRRGIDNFYDNNGAGGGPRGDSIDNDGDGLIDEEIFDTLDNDGDGATDEDLAAVGYPKSLRALVLNHWLRRVPKEPFNNTWQYRTSTDPPGTWRNFNLYGNTYEVTDLVNHDIYDVRTDGGTNETALDGSAYSTW